MKVRRKHIMKVYKLGGRSMIRIIGDYLSDEFGYNPGDEIEVEYCKDGSIRIKHIDKSIHD
ncbi:MAG: hypothetical protein K6E47_07510 [Lachnospiraceae bacterium]|nr:hypothetical protein [Lachnospiraceae bacterium]